MATLKFDFGDTPKKTTSKTAPLLFDFGDAPKEKAKAKAKATKPVATPAMLAAAAVEAKRRREAEAAPAVATPPPGAALHPVYVAGGALMPAGPAPARTGEAFMAGFAESPLVKGITGLFTPKPEQMAMPYWKDVLKEAEGPFQPKGVGEWLPYLGGAVTGEAPTIAAAYATGGAAGAGALGRLAPQAGPLAQMGARGLGAGLTHGALRSAVEKKPLPEAVRDVLIEGALFGVGDPAVTKGLQLAGRGLQAAARPIAQRLTKAAPKAEKPDLLAQLREAAAARERRPIIPEPPKWERGGGTVQTVRPFLPEQKAATREALAREFGATVERPTQAVVPPVEPKAPVKEPGPGTPLEAALVERLATKRYATDLAALDKAVVERKDELVRWAKNEARASFKPEPTPEQAIDSYYGAYIRSIGARPDDALRARLKKGETWRSRVVAMAEREAVRRAVFEGKPVPEALLKKYPSIARRAQQELQEILDQAKAAKPEPTPVTKPGYAVDALPFHERVAVRTGARPPRQPVVSPRSGGMIEDLPPVRPKSVSQATQREAAVTQQVAMKIPGAQPPTPQAAPRLVTAGRVGYTLDDNKAVAAAALERADVATLKDIGSIKAQAFDLFRIFEEVLGGGAERIFKGLKTPARRLILDPLDKSKGQLPQWEEAQLGALRKNVVNKGIQMHSKESALLQRFGEKNISLDELKKQRPNDWNKFVEADDWFRKQYDDHIEAVNAVYREVYGHNEKLLAERLVPKRQDYYRHMQEVGDFYQQMRHMYSTQAEITPGLVRMTDYVRPRSKWLSIAQRRKGGEFTEDAVAGYLNYVRQAGYHLHITPHIGRLQEFGKLLAEKTGDTKNLNKFIEILTRHEQALAGKTHAIDRPVQEIVGRSAYRLANILNDRIRANLVVWSANTLVAQATHIPMAVAVGKAHAVPGLKNTIKSLLSRKGTPLHWANDPIAKSDFMQERYKERVFRQFETKPVRKFVARGGQLLEDFDRYAATFVWHTMYQKGMGMGFQGQKRIKYADDATRAIIAGRGIGERPYYQQAQLIQLVAPFQVEVNNIVLVHRDLWKGDKAGLMVLFAASFLFNKFSEATRGSALLPDPIVAITDALQELADEDRTAGERVKRAGGRLAGEVIAALPFGQHIGAAVISDPHQRKEVFGRKDPTRYGTGILLSKSWQDPVSLILPPAGGAQAKRTVGGIQSLMQEGAYTKGGNLMFPIDVTPTKAVKGAVFGKWSSPEAREYFDKNRRPLSEKQTEEFKQKVARGQDPKRVYGQIIKKRELAAIDRKIQEVGRDKSIPMPERIRRLRKLREERTKILRGD